MDNSWQSKCGSMWPFLTPAVGSSSQVQPQVAQNQMLNAGYHFYSHVGQEPISSARGIMQEPTFPHTSNFSFHNSGHAELGSSFLSILSGPPSLLQCDLQQLSNQKPFFTSNIVPVNANNIMIRAAGSDVSRAPTGLLPQIIDSKNLKTGVDLPQNVSSRAVTREKCVSAASLHDVLEAANLNRQNFEVAKAVTHHTVSGNDKMKELSSLRGGWLASPSLSHVRKMHNTHIQSSPSSSIPLPPSPFTSSYPCVFCLGASGDLLLSNTGLLGVVCSCHGLHMSISKFSEHSGLRGVNPGDVVRMDNGETIAQWRKVYFHKFGHQDTRW